MITLTNVSKYYGTQEVLKQVSCRILPGEKIGLIGPNGVGKTTLIRLILGQEESSSGNLARDATVRIGYVPQYIEYNQHWVAERALLANYEKAHARLRREEHRLAEASDATMDEALKQYQLARDAYDAMEGDDLPRRAVTILDSLGLGECRQQKIGSLSGGERNVLSLAQALLIRPDLLVLDEPGNHLDFLGMAWLERFLERFQDAVLIVSHNRYLLDRIVHKVFELQDGIISEYHGNYSAYRLAKLRDLVAQQADYAANQKRLAQLEALVRRFADIARNNSDPSWGKRLRARRSQLERERKQAVGKPVLPQAAISLDVEVQQTKADVALQVNGYSKRFGDRSLFENANLEIACGERIALIGPNGSGKTTFLKEVVDRARWDDTVLRLGPSLTIGYCAQNQEIFDPELTILEQFLSLGPHNRHEVFALLSRFLFSWDDMEKRIVSLSGGEKNRLQLARLMILGANFLLLDEPTNHMDIVSKEAIEDSLSAYKGTILLVSHDRYFLDKIATSIVEIRNRRFRPFAGNFSEFWATQTATTSEFTGRVSNRAKQNARHKSGPRHAARPRPSVKNAARQMEVRIAEMEQRKTETEAELTRSFAEGDHQRGRRLSTALAKLMRQLDDLYEQWADSAR